MVNNSYKTKVKGIIERAKQKSKIITYNEYCKTKKSSECILSKEDVNYYISNKEETN